MTTTLTINSLRTRFSKWVPYLHGTCSDPEHTNGLARQKICVILAWNGYAYPVEICDDPM